jgi:hypoxanthine phosphoribosyltransferase
MARPSRPSRSTRLSPCPSSRCRAWILPSVRPPSRPRSRPAAGVGRRARSDLQHDIGEVLLSEEQIAAKVTELGARISADYAGRSVTLVSVLKGSLPFMADLMRAIDLPLRIDLMEVSSYGGNATESSGLVRILKDLSASIEHEDVLIVEDIIDTGLTLNYLVRYLRGKNPATLRICTLLDKPARRLVEIPVDYIGFQIPDQFVVGYGLDYGELYRNLRFVGVLKPEVYGAGDLEAGAE